jgi:TnpA family transposase
LIDDGRQSSADVLQLLEAHGFGAKSERMSGRSPQHVNDAPGDAVGEQFTGLNAIPVPGTLRDSLVLLAVVLEQQTELKPTWIMSDTGAYSDVVFGPFRLISHRFCPRIADIGGTRFWRRDRQADYGKLNGVSQHQLKLQRIAPHWDDMLRLAGSLLQERVPATGIMRTLQVGDNPTRLAQTIAEFGRIDKTLHSLRYIDDKDMRRGTLTQLNRGEGRYSVARVVFSGKRGELRQRCREGQEDQLGALGLVVNMIVLIVDAGPGGGLEHPPRNSSGHGLLDSSALLPCARREATISIL